MAWEWGQGTLNMQGRDQERQRCRNGEQGPKRAQVGDKGHGCRGDGDTGAHKQGTKDPDAVGTGTGKLPQGAGRGSGTPLLWGQGHTQPQGQGSLAHTD